MVVTKVKGKQESANSLYGRNVKKCDIYDCFYNEIEEHKFERSLFICKEEKIMC